MPLDLIATRQQLLEQNTGSAAQMAESARIAQSDACAHVFRQLMLDDAAAVAGRPGIAATPLAGLAVSVKDLFDVAGQTTAAGSRVLEGAPPATEDCPAVARLKAAGGAVIGRTHMVEFAFSGVGVNPHFGTPAAWDARREGPAADGTSAAVPRIPGGSSSGAAVSVATGCAFIGLGSDTGGSIRIPAALNGIVGFKNTARLVPTDGAVPLSTTLDTVCAMTRSVRDAIVAHEILADRRVGRNSAPLSSYRLAVARTAMLDAMDAPVARAFDRSLRIIRDAGAKVVEIDLGEISQLGPIQSTGGFSAAESYAWHRELMARDVGGTPGRFHYDPRVSARIERGAAMKAWEYVDLFKARRAWIAAVTARLQGFDAVLSPTVPITAPPIADVAPGPERDDAFFRVNALLLRNPSVVNMLDGCALSLPCHVEGELPVGLMLWHGALHDDVLLNLGLQVESVLAQ